MRSIALILLLLALTYAQTPLSPLPTTIITSRYTNNIVLESGVMTMYWALNNTAGTIEIGLTCNGCNGYIGWGLSKATGMLNSDVILSWFNGDGSINCQDYSIGTVRVGTCPNGVCLDTSLQGTNDVLQYNGSVSGQLSTIIFTRKLVTGDSLDVPITPKSLTQIYAYQFVTKGPNFVQHTKIPTPVQLNYFTGASSTKINLQVVHGGLMFVAWFGLAPFGFILARFMKGFSWWFQVHRAIMLLSMAIQVCGFAVIVSEVPKGYHFNVAHKIIGLIVFIIGVSQPLIGFLADKFFNPDRKSTPIFPDKTHWVLGWVSITLGMINIILGLMLYGKTKESVLIAYCVVAAVVFAGCVGFSVFRIIKPADGGHK